MLVIVSSLIGCYEISGKRFIYKHHIPFELYNKIQLVFRWNKFTLFFSLLKVAASLCSLKIFIWWSYTINWSIYYSMKPIFDGWCCNFPLEVIKGNKISELIFSTPFMESHHIIMTYSRSKVFIINPWLCFVILFQ